jgi:hypothetical protein
MEIGANGLVSARGKSHQLANIPFSAMICHHCPSVSP